MSMKILAFRVFVLIFTVALISPVSAWAAGSSQTVNIQFVNHIQAGLPEQDVFVGGEGLKPGRVVRVDVKDAAFGGNLAKEVFAAGRAVEHDPFKQGKRPLGPFPQGQSLGFILQRWLAATGSGTYRTDGTTAHMMLRFRNLVPRGAYTVWCSRVTFPPSPKVLDRPCGAADGSQNIFRAGTQGTGFFQLNLDPLPPSSRETKTVIAIAYHSDGKTYGAHPGAFGLNSHVQLFFALPELATHLTHNPSDGWKLHVDAKRHFPSNSNLIAHHYCKPIIADLQECQLYDSDEPDAKLVGVETVVTPKVFKSFSAEEKKLWHYHKQEIPNVDPHAPGLSAQEEKALIKSFEETYGKIYLLWDPGKQTLPLGHPVVAVLP